VKKLVLSAVVVCAGLVVAMRARAGYESVQPVVVGSGYAYGNLSDARNSSDGSEFIGCLVVLNLNSTGSVNNAGYTCEARNSAGASFFCSGSDTGVATTLSSGLKGDSYIEFYGEQLGNCTTIVIEQNSWIAPKNP
jgi:hypothetical protein